MNIRPDGYGYRARIGIVYIASSVGGEPEFHVLCPAGVSVHVTRISLPRVDVGELTALGDSGDKKSLAEAVSLLAEAPLQTILFACTAGSFVGGPAYDQELLQEMARYSRGIPVTTTTTASVAGLRALHAERIVIVAPYLREVTQRAVDYFSNAGFEVVNWSTMGIEDDVEIGNVPLERVVEAVESSDRSEADAVFISCTNLRTIGVLEELEARLRKPVVSANQASFWHALRLSGLDDAVPGYGRLLEPEKTGGWISSVAAFRLPKNKT